MDVVILVYKRFLLKPVSIESFSTVASYLLFTLKILVIKLGLFNRFRFQLRILITAQPRMHSFNMQTYKLKPYL